jgi:transposase
MNQPAIFAATLGLSHPWQIVSISFTSEENRVDISIDFSDSSILSCPCCGVLGIICSSVKETWHHHDYFRFAAYLHALVPSIECPSCGIVTVDRPWTRKGSMFTHIL